MKQIDKIVLSTDPKQLEEYKWGIAPKEETKDDPNPYKIVEVDLDTVYQLQLEHYLKFNAI